MLMDFDWHRIYSILDQDLNDVENNNQEQLLRELDMYQEIAVAKGAAYDHLNRKMDHCQENIETLSDQIQRLQGETMILILELFNEKYVYLTLQYYIVFLYENIGLRTVS